MNFSPRQARTMRARTRGNLIAPEQGGGADGCRKAEKIHEKGTAGSRNDDGEEIKVVQFVVPPSVTGMCLYLGIDRSTWQNYADAALHPELAGICQGARTRIEAYLEQELLTREKGVQGIIFNLQNNYGWKQKQEVELGKDTRESMKHAATYHEKLALLRADDGESECDEDEVDGL